MSKRAWPLLALACAASAVLLSLSVSGTLSSWTSAVINNSSNTAATAQAVILQEVNGANTCLSSAGSGNSYTCSTINKYGGTTTPLGPGGSQVTTVTFTNVGSANASTLVLTPGICTSTPTIVVGAPAANDLCTTSNEMALTLSCISGSTTWSDMTYSGRPGALPALTHLAGLASGIAVTCTFTVSLPSAASVLDQGVVVSQPLTWTLNK